MEWNDADGGYTSDGPVVEVEQGRLGGDVREGVRRFRGIPYAEPPVGPLRFRSPRPVAGWTGIRPATAVGSGGYQIDAQNRESIGALIARRDPGVPGVIPVPPAFVVDTVLQSSSEDCLYIDVYVPEAALGDEPLPVYLYYHGGANYVNSAAGRHEFQSGENLARAENIIVVQPQYRLGALGWVHFGLIDDRYAEAVNLGLQDQIAALKWVSANIASFGGDPGNITIGGESAGGTAVSHLIANPETRRYARRAILQSLSPFNTWCTQREPDARTVAEVYRDILGADNLQTVDPDEFIALQSVLLRVFDPDVVVAWRPHGGVVDGTLIHDLPVLQLAESGLSDLGAGESAFEVMIGFAQDEWQFFRGHTPTFQSTDRETAIAVLADVFDEEGAARVYDAYAALYPQHPPAHLLSDIMACVFFKFSSMEIARTLSAQGIDVYVFQFSYPHPGSGGYLRALHTGTLPFVFRNTSPEQLRAWRSLEGADIDEVDRVAAEFGALYAQFIRDGETGGPWERYDPERESILWFGNPVEARPGLLQGERAAFGSAGITRTAQLETRLLDRLHALLPEALGAVTARR
jgi:para-nitrobenzyl esterase